MPIHLNKKDGALLYHRDRNPAEKYSIFGTSNAMNFAYVDISNEERNYHGLYTELTVKEFKNSSKDITILKTNPAGIPLWTLPSYKEKQIEELSPPPTPKHEQVPVDHSDSYPLDNDDTDLKINSFKFLWPYGGTSVSVTGAFDNWEGSIVMTPVSSSSENVFEATVHDLDFSKDVLYKYVVDGRWCYDVKKDHVIDETGNINNIIRAQKKLIPNSSAV